MQDHVSRVASAESLALAGRLGGVRLDSPSTAWQSSAASVFPVGPHGECKGFLGQWRFYRPTGADDQSLDTPVFPCLRTYSTEGYEFVFRNYHQNKHSFGKAQKRAIDGLYENVHRRSFDDPYFDCTMALMGEEEAEGLQLHLVRRCIRLQDDLAGVVRLAPTLPPQPSEGNRGELKDYIALWSAARAVHKGKQAWAFEAFMQDSDNRWSLGPLYHHETLRLMSHFCVQEYATNVDPLQPIDLAKGPLKDARPRLDEVPAKWMDGGSWVGQLRDTIWDEDGEMMTLPPRPALWRPPNPSQPNMQLFLYPDCIYGFFPVRLAAANQDAVPTFQNAIRFEVGGLMRNQNVFRRIIIRYSVQGPVQSMTEESYQPRQ